MFGSPETTTGGRALKFYASMRMDVRRVESIKVGDNIVGNRTKVKIVKNKVAPPFKQVEFDIMYGQGISRTGDVLDTAVDEKVIVKSGSWYSFEGERIGQGRENVKVYLEEHQDVMERVEHLLMEKLDEEQEEESKADQEPELVAEEDIDAIMDMLVDDDGVVME